MSKYKRDNIKTKILIPIIIFYFILIGTSFARPLIIKHIMDDGLVKTNMQIIIMLSITLFLISLVEESVRVVQTKFFLNLQNKIILESYTKAFYKLTHIKYQYFEKHSPSEIVNRLSSDIDKIGLLIDSEILYVVGYVLQIISGIVGLFIINFNLAILVLGIIPIKFFLIRVMSRKKEKIVNVWIEQTSKFVAWFGDIIGGMREIKLWNLHAIKEAIFITKQEKVLELGKESRIWDTYNQSTDELIQWFLTACIYLIGGYYICNKLLTIGGLTAFLTYSGYVTGPIAVVFNLKMLFAQVKPSINRLKDFYKEKEEKAEVNDECSIRWNRNIVFKNIYFSYERHSVLRDIDFKINKGETVAIVGKNGSGKSTLINLILRFLEPQYGSILLDGIDIRRMPLEQYRALFGVVTQDIYLFNDTIYNNMTMGLGIDDSEMKRISKKLRINEFVEKYPGGYENIIDENGANLSGGERQKIALFRAIIKDTPILIFDEATSNLDKEYDELIQNLINIELNKKTIIIITHNARHLKNVDKIYNL